MVQGAASPQQMPYQLHCFCQSGNAFKVALYLNCAGLKWEPIFVDFMNGATRDADWRANVNAMGEAPVLDHDGKRLTQSGVILSYLAEKTGHFAPASEDEKREALRWILFDNHKFTANFATYRFLKSFVPTAPDPAVMTFLKGRFDGAAAIVDKHLAGRDYMLGVKPSIADFSLAGYMFYPVEESGYDWPTAYPNIGRWIDRMRAMPGWQDPYQLLPGPRIKPLR